MAAQFDFIAGVDISSLSSVTQAQLMQMINQIAPLSNIGGVIVQAGTSTNPHFNEGVGGSPSVTDNPRFARYIWLNTHDAATAAPTPYYYDASMSRWTSTSIAAGSITNTEIASNAAIDVTKLAPHSIQRYILRTNGNHTAVEYAAPENIFNVNELPVNSLVKNGSDGYLKTTGGGASVSWVSNAVERSAIQDSITALPVAQLQVGSVRNILYVNDSAQVVWGAPSTAFNGASNIPLNALSNSGVLDKNLLMYSGSSWSPITQSLIIATTNTVSTTGLFSSYLADTTTGSDGELDENSFSIPHGLGVVPKLWRVVIQCKAADTAAGYAVNDEITPESWISSLSGEVSPLFTLYADANYIYGTKRTTVVANQYVQKKGVVNNVRVNPTSLANFRYKAYAWA